MERTTAPARSLTPAGNGEELDQAEVMNHQLKIEDRRRPGVAPDVSPDVSEATDEQVEADWFAMGGQESWIESRPHAPRSWEAPAPRRP